jgi:hypothetical protein
MADFFAQKFELYIIIITKASQDVNIISIRKENS